MDILKIQVKTDMNTMKTNLTEMQKSLEFTLGGVIDLKKQLQYEKKDITTLREGTKQMNVRINDLSKKLKKLAIEKYNLIL